MQNNFTSSLKSMFSPEDSLKILPTLEEFGEMAKKLAAGKDSRVDGRFLVGNSHLNVFPQVMSMPKCEWAACTTTVTASNSAPTCARPRDDTQCCREIRHNDTRFHNNA